MNVRVPGQRGIALLTAMFIVALATIAAVAMFESTQIAVRRQANLSESEAAWWYAAGVESWVKGVLLQDARNNKVDGLGDIWAQSVDFLPIDNGVLRGRIVDLQGRFNLNNLATPDPARLKIYQAQFQRLLQFIPNLPLDDALGLGSAIRDWVDPDDQRSDLNGAEDNEYLSLDPPYRAANQMMASVSELLAVRGMTPAIYRALQPYVAALPITNAAINVNTAPEPVLRSLSSKIDDSALERFLKARKASPAQTGSAVLSGDTGFLLADDTLHPETLIDVKSRFFQLQAEVFIGSSRVALYSTYLRPDGDGTSLVIAHSTDVD